MILHVNLALSKLHDLTLSGSLNNWITKQSIHTYSTEDKFKILAVEVLTQSSAGQISSEMKNQSFSSAIAVILIHITKALN